jgi:E3 ubiquitin-protein ligase RNF115/126
MLEIHLRDEILSLRTALDAGGGSVSAKSGPRKLTARERHAALRSLLLDTDSLCGQPSCPICSEDFKEGITVTQIQCSHFFHDACVLPWLEMKRSCPICRFEISAAAPEPETLGALTESELRSRIRWLGCPSDLKDSSKYVRCC